MGTRAGASTARAAPGLLGTSAVRKPLNVRAATGLRMVARKTVPLAPTAAGVAIDASGRVEVRARGWEQHFEVGLDAAVPDGTTFIVFANGEPAGTITISAGAGDLYVNNLEHLLPAGVDPVCDMSTVKISDGRGTVLLRGVF